MKEMVPVAIRLAEERNKMMDEWIRTIKASSDLWDISAIQTEKFAEEMMEYYRLYQEIRTIEKRMDKLFDRNKTEV